jgi:P-type conjugative transfer protein TrbG
MIRAFLLASTSLLLAPMAFAQQPNVPAIQATANATGISNTTANATVNTGGQQRQAADAQHPIPPAGWPPQIPLMSPNAKLDHKEVAATTLAKAWINKVDRPMRDANGVLRWMFGTSQARVVCAPLQACDIVLQPGEVINNIIIGDPTYWHHFENISAGQDGRTSHVTLQVLDAGRNSSLLIYTDQRTYALKLVSVQYDYTPLTGFTYPQTQQDEQDSWANYKLASAGKGGFAGHASGGVDPSHIEPLAISGDKPSWRPSFAYTDGRKTYIQFQTGLEFGDSPTLLGVNNDGGVFSSPTQRRIIYRWEGRRLVADAVMDKMELVLGVGPTQEKVTIARKF